MDGRDEMLVRRFRRLVPLWLLAVALTAGAWVLGPPLHGRGRA